MRRLLLAATCVLLTAVPAVSQTLRIALRQDLDVLDPTLATTYVGRIVFAGLCDKLFDIDEKLNIVPQLATGYEWADDRTLVIRLRPDVKFHNGEVLDAAAVKYSLERHLTLQGSFRRSEINAIDHVEVVRISAEDFQLMLDKFPDVRHSLEATAHQRLAENRSRTIRTENVPVDQFLAQGLMEAQSLLVLDLERCTRCDQCVRACADAHDGVSRLVREGLRFDKYLVATSCRQCRDPLCMVGCPVGSIRRRNTLEVIIEDWCIGCGLCATNCPYGNINLHPFPVEVDDPAHPGRQIASVKVKATSCDLCHDHAEPSCVYACPHDAAHRVNPPEFFANIIQPQSLTTKARS